MNLIEKLIDSVAKLPGIGKKSASRIVYYLLKTEAAFAEKLSQEILELKKRITLCRICGNYTEEQPCPVCQDQSRDQKTLCVVEQPKDVLSMESIREYRGLYHVLLGVISPIDGVGPEDLRLLPLVDRVRAEGIEEIILALNPTVEGDTTALYISELLKSEEGVRVSRLALGLPVGGDLEYTDRLTLLRALKGRNPV